MSPKLKIIAVIAIAALAAACGPKKQNDNGNAPNQTTMQNQSTMQGNGMGGGRGRGQHRGGRRLRSACATEIQSYCSSADKVGRCLRNYSAKLSSGCQQAMNEMRERRRERKMNNGGMNNGGFNNGGMNGNGMNGGMNGNQRPLQQQPNNNNNSNNDDGDD